MKKAMTPERMDREYAEACFLLEHELHIAITEDYPAAKFAIACEELKKYGKKQEEQAGSLKRKGGLK